MSVCRGVYRVQSHSDVFARGNIRQCVIGREWGLKRQPVRTRVRTLTAARPAAPVPPGLQATPSLLHGAAGLSTATRRRECRKRNVLAGHHHATAEDTPQLLSRMRPYIHAGPGCPNADRRKSRRELGGPSQGGSGQGAFVRAVGCRASQLMLCQNSQTSKRRSHTKFFRTSGSEDW